MRKGLLNLLSLKGSIEAARAGEAGKGFAVGSEEILASSEIMVTNCGHVTDNSKKVDDESKQLKETADKLDTYAKRFIVDKGEKEEND